jgi:protein-S-isoprenylcysteine O-methyltransferase Ste14
MAVAPSRPPAVVARPERKSDGSARRAAQLRNLGCNVLLAGAFFVAAYPNVRHYGTSLANGIWAAGAIIMGALSLIRVAPRAVMLDVRAFAATGAMFAAPCLMRPTSASSGVILSLALGLEIVGLVLSETARIYMGRSFGVLPANRGIVSRGPFRVVRHPVYLGWFILSTGFALAYPSARNFALLALTIPFMLWRIRLEEELLAHDGEYRVYSAKVRYRLIPGVI